MRFVLISIKRVINLSYLTVQHMKTAHRMNDEPIDMMTAGFANAKLLGLFPYADSLLRMVVWFPYCLLI